MFTRLRPLNHILSIFLAKKPNREIMKFEELQKTQPAGRGQTVMVRDSVSGKPIIYGGLGQGFKEFKDVWSFDFEKLEWSKISEFDKPTWFHSGFRISLLSISVKYPVLPGINLGKIHWKLIKVPKKQY